MHVQFQHATGQGGVINYISSVLIEHNFYFLILASQILPLKNPIIIQTDTGNTEQ